MAYTFGTTVEGDIESVRERVTEELGKEGFGILTTIDVAATLKAKIDVDRDPYIILGACNPKLANEAITMESDIGALLPCNVVLIQDGDTIAVRFMDPEAVLGLVDRPEVATVASQVREKLQRVRAAISS
jgi:uncharacterized protein (DUF302 family)